MASRGHVLGNKKGKCFSEFLCELFVNAFKIFIIIGGLVTFLGVCFGDLF